MPRSPDEHPVRKRRQEGRQPAEQAGSTSPQTQACFSVKWGPCFSSCQALESSGLSGRMLLPQALAWPRGYRGTCHYGGQRTWSWLRVAH